MLASSLRSSCVPSVDVPLSEDVPLVEGVPVVEGVPLVEGVPVVEGVPAVEGVLPPGSAAVPAGQLEVTAHAVAAEDPAGQKLPAGH